MANFISALHRGSRALQIAKISGLVTLVAVLAVAFNVASTRTTSADSPNATIIGKVLKPDGTAFSFTCQPGPGQTGTAQPCGIGVQATAGPGMPGAFAGASMTDGSFTLSVVGGQKYQVDFRGPQDGLSGYTFTPVFVEIGSGVTKDLGTIVPTEKTGRISGIVTDVATGAPVSGASVSAFPMFGGPGNDDSGPKTPMMPSQASTATNGTFTLKVDPGKYGVNLDQRPDSVYVYSGQPIEANCDTATCNIAGIAIAATKADATITGKLLREDGTDVFFPGGVSAHPVGSSDFTQYNGPIMPANQGIPNQGPPNQGTPNDGGIHKTDNDFNNPNQASIYTVKVPSSTAQYSLNVFLPPDSGFSLKDPITVTVTPGGTTTQNLVVAADTSSIFGKVVSQTGFALSSCSADGGKFGGNKFGEVFAHSPSSGKFYHADIDGNCAFNMKVGVGTYEFGYHLNPQAGFINRPAPPDPITVAANTNVEKNITVQAGDAHILGQVLGPDGAPMSNVWVDAGNEGEARQNFQTAGQQGPQNSNPDQFQGPGGTKSPQDMMKYCGDPAHANECKNAKLPPGSTGPGNCTNMLECSQYCQKNQQVCAEFDKGGHGNPGGPGSPAVQGQGVKAKSVKGRVHKLAEDVTQDTGSDFLQNIIHAGAQTDVNGKFDVTLVSGHQYQVRMHLPPDRDNGQLIPGQAVQVDLRTAKTASIALQFRAAFGTMTGKVFLATGAPADRCHVFYWNEAGDNGDANCKPDGSFSMGYGQGKLHIGADSFTGRTLYRAPEEIVIITSEKTITKNFSLQEQKGISVPTATSKTFDSSQQTTITADNGAQIVIPAGAMGSSGNVTVTMSPTTNIPVSENDNPLGGLGYTLQATDANGKAITTFSSNVQVVMPYDTNYVKNDLGLDPSLITAKFKDDTTNALQAPDSVANDTSSGMVTVSTNHFTDYTIVTPGGVNLKSVKVAANGKNTKITIDSKTTIKLNGSKDTWNIGTANFGTKLGQLIAVSNKKSGGKVMLYSTTGKLSKTITPFKGFTGGLNQVVEDVTAKSGKTPDGTDDVIVAPATDGPSQADVIDLKSNVSQMVTTGSGKGQTTVNTAALKQAGIANLTTLFKTGKTTTAKAFGLSKGKLAELTGTAVAGSLTVKDGKVEKKTVSPKVSKVGPKCSASASTKLTITGSGFGTSPVVLWNATSALAAKTTKADTEFQITVNPSAINVKTGANTLTIVNSDGLAGVGVATCGL